MRTSFDIPPTEPLSGIHMLGTVVRRFLISYAVAPEALAGHIPPGAELSLYGGRSPELLVEVNFGGLSFGDAGNQRHPTLVIGRRRRGGGAQCHASHKD